MPLQPTRSMLHVNSLLRNVSIAYQQKAENYVADLVFPQVAVQKQSDRYMIYNKGDWFRTVAAKRAPATPSVGTGYSIDNTPTYFCDIWAVHHDVPLEDYDNADDIDVDTDATELVTANNMLRKELIFVKKYMQPVTWQGFAPGGVTQDFLPNNTATGGNGYWGAASANPAADINIGKQSILSTTGQVANTLVMTADVWFAIQNNPNLVDRYKYTQAGILTKELIAGVFGVERVLVVQAVINTAQEGQANQMGFMTRNCALLCYSAPSPGLRRPSAGYTFSWTGRRNAGGSNTTINKFYMEDRKAFRVEGEMAFDMRMTGSDLGIFYSQVLSAT